VAAEFELTDAMKAVVGVEGSAWPVEVTTTSVRAFARGVGYTDLVYYDEDAAKAAGYSSLPAPATYMGTYVWLPGGKSDPVFSQPRADGPSLSHGLKNVLDGGTEITYERTIVAGDRLLARSKVVDLEVKESKSLGKMLVVTMETAYTEAASGNLVARLRGQGIYY
jgi:hypothetical protein